MYCDIKYVYNRTPAGTAFRRSKIYLNVHGVPVLLGKFIEQDLKSNGNLGVSLGEHISSRCELTPWDIRRA